MTEIKNKKQKDFMDMLINFLQKLLHVLKDFCCISENFIIGVLLRKIVNWHDKRRGHYISRKEIKQLKEKNELLKKKLTQMQSSRLSDLEELKGQVEMANRTIDNLRNDLDKLSNEVKILN